MPNPILGKGERTYEAIHDWLMPPDNLKWGDTHGLAQDAQGRIYVAHTVHPTSRCADAIAVFDDKSKFIKSWGAEFNGGAHGLELRKEGGQEFLYHCDVKRRIFAKSTLDGEILWRQGAPEEAGVYSDKAPFNPTNIAFAPDGGFYVADGYGSSYVHKYDKNDHYVRTIGQPGEGVGQLKCPHGAWVDDRNGQAKLVVADRGNRRLQYFTLDGKHLGFVTDGMRLPCHFKIRGDQMLIPDLESVVTLLDKNNKVLAHLGQGAGNPNPLRSASREKFIPGQFIHPHGAIFLATGDILVAEWVQIGRVTLLRKKN